MGSNRSSMGQLISITREIQGRKRSERRVEFPSDATDHEAEITRKAMQTELGRVLRKAADQAGVTMEEAGQALLSISVEQQQRIEEGRRRQDALRTINSMHVIVRRKNATTEQSLAALQWVADQFPDDEAIQQAIGEKRDEIHDRAIQLALRKVDAAEREQGLELAVRRPPRQPARPPEGASNKELLFHLADLWWWRLRVWWWGRRKK